MTFFQRGLTIIKLLRSFGIRSIKTLQSFNPFPSMPSVTTGDRTQCHYIQTVFNNKTISLVLELMGRHLLAFYKVAK